MAPADAQTSAEPCLHNPRGTRALRVLRVRFPGDKISPAKISYIVSLDLTLGTSARLHLLRADGHGGKAAAAVILPGRAAVRDRPGTTLDKPSKTKYYSKPGIIRRCRGCSVNCR